MTTPKRCSFLSIIGFTCLCTAGPLSSGDPGDFENWALNRGWPFNRGTI